MFSNITLDSLKGNVTVDQASLIDSDYMGYLVGPGHNKKYT